MKQTKKKIVWLVAFLAVGSIQVFGKPFAVGPYLGQTPPGPVAQVFAPGLICDTRPRQWEAWPSFSADGNSFCFNRLRYVYVTENTDQGWTTPKRIESIPYYSVSCCLSPDANSIYVRCGPFSKLKRRRTLPSKYSLRRCMRTSQGFNEPGSYWFAPFVGNTWPRAIKIPVGPIEGGYNGCHPGVAPDESFLVFYSKRPGAPGGTETDLYLTLRRPDGTWTKLRNMGPRINTGYFEWGARISPDKKYMFFNRSTGWNLRPVSDTGDIYWVELKEYLPESYR
jgi:hypothetical protein